MFSLRYTGVLRPESVLLVPEKEIRTRFWQLFVNNEQMNRLEMRDKNYSIFIALEYRS